VLESLYPFEYVEKRHLYAVLLGVCYSIIALGISVLIFPTDPSLISLGIVTLLLYPTVQKLLKEHELIESNRFHPGLFSFFREHRSVLIFYLIICLSIFTVFFSFSYMNPQNNSILFTQQEAVVNSMTGGASAMMDNALYYFIHNSKVLILIFIATFILGEGGLLLLSWNASSWGVFFGAYLATSHLSSGASLLLLLTVLPHIILEISAYIIAGITASILSRAYYADHISKRKRQNVLLDSFQAIALAFLVLAVAAIIETGAFAAVRNLF